MNWNPLLWGAPLVRLGIRRPWLVLTSVLLLVIAAMVQALGLRAELDILSLMPSDNEAVENFQSTLERFGSADVFLVGIEVGDQPVEATIELADLLVGKMRSSDHFRWVEYRQEDLLAAVAELLPKATLFLDDAQLDEVRNRLTPEGMRLAAERLAARVRSPMSLGMRELLVEDPLDLSSLALSGIGSEAGERFDETGYVLDPENQWLLIVGKPSQPAGDIQFSRDLIAHLDKQREEALSEWRELGHEGLPPTIHWAGGHAIAVSDGGRIQQDMVVGALGALLAVGILFAFAFRSPGAAVLAFTPLLAGLAITAAFAMLAYGRLNAATSAFAAMLIGLGVDFVIVLYGRYLEERAGGRSAAESLEVLAVQTTPSVVVGATTTAATLLTLVISDFRGLSELGALTGVGILIVAMTVFVTLPALLMVLDGNRPSRGRGTLRAFGLGRLALRSRRQPRPVFVIAALLTLAAIGFAPRLEYREDTTVVRSPDNPAAVVQRRLTDAFGLRFTPYLVRIDGSSQEKVLERVREVTPRVRELVGGKSLARVESALDFLPSLVRQREALARVASWGLDREAIRHDLSRAVEAAGLAPEAFAPGIDNVAHAVTLTQPLDIGSLATGSLAPVLGRYWSEQGGEVATLLYAYTAPGAERGAPPPALEAIADEYPDVMLTGAVMVTRELKGVVRRDAALAGALGLLLVLVLLSLSFRSLLFGALALLPLAVGAVWMVGVMAALRVDVNFLNLFVFAMLIGIAVDYGVHLVHRFRESGLHRELEQTARAVAVAAITTVLGFGSLSFSHFPGLRSMGIAAVIGATTTCFAALTLLPAIFARLEARRPQPDREHSA